MQDASMDFERRDWMAVLARAPLDLLRRHYAEWRLRHEGQRVVGPEMGLIQLRGSAPLTGTPFHMGEATVTRCVVSVGAASGYAVLLGHDPERAEMAAYFDGLLQHPAHRQALARTLVRPALEAIETRRQRKADAAKATAVQFFTAARGGIAP
mgnify:CR=1 FL=1